MEPKQKPEPISDYDLDRRYKELLDDCWPPAKIANYEYQTSKALEEIDPVAYRCGFADFISFELEENLVEIDGKFYDRHEWESFQESEKEI